MTSTILVQAVERKPHWLYLIDSGNDDWIYKIGITGRSIEERLEEIKVSYCVPKATVINQRLIIGEYKAKTVEKELHELCYDCHEYTYAGKEFFELDETRLALVRTYYSATPEATSQE